MPDFADLYELSHCADCLFYRNVWIHPVKVINLDTVKAEAFE
jgi:hypothetical protein